LPVDQPGESVPREYRSGPAIPARGQAADGAGTVAGAPVRPGEQADEVGGTDSDAPQPAGARTSDAPPDGPGGLEAAGKTQAGSDPSHSDPSHSDPYHSDPADEPGGPDQREGPDPGGLGADAVVEDRVRHLVAGLDGIEKLPLAEHAQRYADVHGKLQGALTEIDGESGG
jgi:hypothetical protein